MTKSKSKSKSNYILQKKYVLALGFNFIENSYEKKTLNNIENAFHLGMLPNLNWRFFVLFLDHFQLHSVVWKWNSIRHEKGYD